MSEGALKKFAGIVVGGPLDGAYFESDSQLIEVPMNQPGLKAQTVDPKPVEMNIAQYSAKDFRLRMLSGKEIVFWIWSLNDKEHNVDYIMRQLIANYERKKAK